MSVPSMLKNPWVVVDNRIGESLESELYKELSSDHPLSGIRLHSVARSEANDDVLYADEDSGSYYLVHLTWAKEKSDRYPSFESFDSMELFIHYCLETSQFYEDEED
ncbi:hypothetical protein M3231_20545 [Neobacillus mesonae]|nr:hypothetical protein [Neobacillus mesonae]